MKVTIDIDCTPEEARRAMGLPDVSELNSQMIDAMKDRITKGFGPEEMDNLMKLWLGGAGNGLGEMQKAFFSMMNTASKG